jgi:hypothetical protein|tara:strand:- start:79 stop:288 length:210 start_codon:yes stop_codon:yes gene_type:complete
MRYLFKGDKNNPFLEIAKQFKPRKAAKLTGNNFLVTLNPEQAKYFRNIAASEKKTANSYLSEFLNKIER